MPRPARSHDRLAGKAAIVTGGGSPEGGIGRAISLLLASEGAKVCVIDLEEARAREVADIIISEGGTAIAVAGDVSNKDDCKRMVEAALAAFGTVDILVNNVGISNSPQSLIDMDVELWQRVMDVNLKGAVLMSSNAVPAMKAAGGGAIVNIASIAGMQAYGGAGYGPSKAAMIQFTRETAVMHGPDGIRANVVAPGHVYTAHIAHMFTPEIRAARKNVGPLGIEGDDWDIAQAVLFLASDEARFITGVLLPVDGGVTQIGPLAGMGMVTRRS
jgi:NAD(P)-dependent dehydrogenase (short-subunit alcohol dehydrogenase family)